jgi:exonuclease VII large subunit
MFKQHSFRKKFELIEETISNLQKTFNQQMKQKIIRLDNELELLEKSYISHNPSKKLSYGYVQVTKNGLIIDIDTINLDESINLESTKHKFECKITSKQEIS